MYLQLFCSEEAPLLVVLGLSAESLSPHLAMKHTQSLGLLQKKCL